MKIRANSKFRQRTLLIAVVIASVNMAAPGQLANAAILEEVVVTAQKHAQRVNDIGITVNVFCGDVIKDLGVSSAGDMAQLTPGLTVNETAATGVPLYTIRGIGFQDYSTAASSAVGLYFDEVAVPYTVMSRGPVFDVERVEVLKGPQGDLYGRNTTAGQINFISNKPTEEFEAGFTAGYGRFDLFDLEGFISGGLSDSVQARVTFKTRQSGEGWQNSQTRNDELGEKDANAIRALFNFNLSQDIGLRLNLHYVKDKSDNKANTSYNGALAGLAVFNNPYTPLNQYLLPTGEYFGETPPWYSTGDSRAADWTNSYTSPITGSTWDLRPKRDNELKGLSVKLEWGLGEITLTSITGYDDFERQEANDWDGGFFNDSSNINATDLQVFSQELRLSGKTDSLLWVAGVYYSKDEMDEYYHYFLSDSVFGFGSISWGVGQFALTPILEIDTKYSQETESRAVFGHLEWRFTDKMQLTVGLRYTEEERDWSGCTFVASDGSLAGYLNAQFDTSLEAGDCGTIDDDPNSPTYIFNLIGRPNVNDAFHVFGGTISTEKWMGKVGVDYAVTKDLLIYATYSNAFKSGGFNGANSNTTLQLQPYDEEQVTAFEVGIKSTLFDGAMQLNAAAFWYDYEDKQEQDLAVVFVGNLSGLTNVPESRINGAELDLQWAPMEGLSINLGVAYLDTLIEEWDATSNASTWPTVVTFDASGLELAQSPEWTYNGMVHYEWPVGEVLMLEVGADVNFTDDTTGGAQPSNATNDYTLYNARAGVKDIDGKWRAFLWGRNITDEDYYPAAYIGGNGPYVRSMGVPVTYGVSLSYNF